jgi:hypothetical protein
MCGKTFKSILCGYIPQERLYALHAQSKSSMLPFPFRNRLIELKQPLVLLYIFFYAKFKTTTIWIVEHWDCNGIFRCGVCALISGTTNFLVSSILQTDVIDHRRYPLRQVTNSRCSTARRENLTFGFSFIASSKLTTEYCLPLNSTFTRTERSEATGISSVTEITFP